jgi:hypothetical protein
MNRVSVTILTALLKDLACPVKEGVLCGAPDAGLLPVPEDFVTRFPLNFPEQVGEGVVVIHYVSLTIDNNDPGGNFVEHRGALFTAP